MSLTFRTLDKKDYKKAMDFAIRGMHCNVYFDSDFLCKIYGRFLLYTGLVNATQIIAAYDGDRYLGLLLSRMDGEESCFHGFVPKLFVGVIDTLTRFFSLFFHGDMGGYPGACQEMLAAYEAQTAPDGEITYLAVDPDQEGNGIGTALLHEYESRECGKEVYLYTDDQCTWQFYEHRGFTKSGEKDIVMDIKGGFPLRCMLYSKKISRETAGKRPENG